VTQNNLKRSGFHATGPKAQIPLGPSRHDVVFWRDVMLPSSYPNMPITYYCHFPP